MSDLRGWPDFEANCQTLSAVVKSMIRLWKPLKSLHWRHRTKLDVIEPLTKVVVRLPKQRRVEGEVVPMELNSYAIAPISS